MGKRPVCFIAVFRLEDGGDAGIDKIARLEDGIQIDRCVQNKSARGLLCLNLQPLN